jgi:hypothetical protein
MGVELGGDALAALVLDPTMFYCIQSEKNDD